MKCENAKRGKGAGKVISNVWVVSKHKVDGNKKLESVQASGLHDGERWREAYMEHMEHSGTA